MKNKLIDWFFTLIVLTIMLFSKFLSKVEKGTPSNS